MINPIQAQLQEPVPPPQVLMPLKILSAIPASDSESQPSLPLTISGKNDTTALQDPTPESSVLIHQDYSSEDEDEDIEAAVIPLFVANTNTNNDEEDEAPIQAPPRTATIAATAAMKGSIPRHNTSSSHTNRGSSNLVHPTWAEHMVRVHFFNPCNNHINEPNNACNYYCLLCGPVNDVPMCRHCLPEHDSVCNGPCHQIYRYMHKDVIRNGTFNPYLSLGDIQYYKANGNNAVHLRPKEPPKTKSPATFTTACNGCNRSINPAWSYCSLACKLVIAEDMMAHSGDSCGGERSRHPIYKAMVGPVPPTAPNNEDHFAQATKKRVVKVPLVGAKRRKCATPQRSAEL